MPAARPRPPALLALAGLGFVSLGLPDGLIGVAWPAMRTTFGVPVGALGALLVATTAGYVTASVASGPLLARWGVGPLLAGSCAATAASLGGWAGARSWPAMVALAVLAGLGAGAIDAALNAWAAERHSPRTLSWLHACYGLGTLLGPVVMSQVLLAARPWRLGYALVAAAQAVLATGFFVSRRRWPAAHGARAALSRTSLAHTLTVGAARLSGLAFFVYAAIEAVAGAWSFSLLAEARGATLGIAATGTGLFWGGLLAGRIVAGLLPAALPPPVLVRSCTVGLVAGAVLVLVASSVPLALLGLALLGAAAGPVFPTLVAVTPRRLGAAHAANAVGVQVAAAALGVAIAPAAVGLLADRIGLEAVAWAMCGCALALLVASETLERNAPAA